MHPLFARRRSFWAYLLFWAGLAVVPWVLFGAVAPFGAAILALIGTVSFALSTLPTYYLCRALPLVAGRGLRVYSSHAAAAIVWSIAFVVCMRVAADVLGVVPAWQELSPAVGRAEAALLGMGALFYLLAASLCYVLAELEQRQQAAEREARLAVLAQRAELSALRAQVHPHFLFNSLNTVSALVGYDPAKAREACVLLAEYLRGTLRAQDQALVSLREEWALSERYLKVEALRLGERLRVEVELAEAARECLVPSLLLQPLVENAMTHGIAPVEAPRPLQIRAERRGGRLVITLENGLDPAPRARDGGLGLANVRARLFAQYGNDATLRIERDAERFTVLLDLPARLPDTSGAP